MLSLLLSLLLLCLAVSALLMLGATLAPFLSITGPRPVPPPPAPRPSRSLTIAAACGCLLGLAGLFYGITY